MAFKAIPISINWIILSWGVGGRGWVNREERKSKKDPREVSVFKG